MICRWPLCIGSKVPPNIPTFAMVLVPV